MQKNVIIFVASCIMGTFAFYNLIQIKNEENDLLQERIGVIMEQKANEFISPQNQQEYEENQQKLQEQYDDLTYQIDTVTSPRRKFFGLFLFTVISVIVSVFCFVYEKRKS